MSKEMKTRYCHCSSEAPMKQFKAEQIHQCTECKFWMREEQYQICDEMDNLPPSEAEMVLFFGKVRNE